MRSRSLSGCAPSAMFSGTLQVTHITSSSMSTRSARGAAAEARRRSDQGGEQRREREAARHHSSLPSERVDERLVDRAAPVGDDPPAAVDDERLGDVGRAVASASFVPTSRTLGKLMPYFLTKRSDAGVESSYVTPSTVPAPALCSVRCARSSTGASSRHGMHHDAQKFSTTTLPRRPATDCVARGAEHGQRAARRGRELAAGDRLLDRVVARARDEPVGEQPDERRARRRRRRSGREGASSSLQGRWSIARPEPRAAT